MLLDRIRDGARRAGVELVPVREGGRHSVFACGPPRFTVPRHAEINELTAYGICRHLQPVPGTRWWGCG